jgi:hypothetical protein
MNVSKTAVIERIARVLAGQHLSINALGHESSAAPDVDSAWPDYCDDAFAVLRTLREPDEAMAAAGDPAVWERMIAAALGQKPSGAAGVQATEEPPEPGTDPLHEGP